MEHSPLNRLPRELRDLVYGYAVAHKNGIVMESDRSPRELRHLASHENEIAMESGRQLLFHGRVEPYNMNQSTRPHNATLALAKVCRQLHEETIGLYYAKNCFYFPLCDYGPFALKTFLQSIKSEHRKMLTSLEIKAGEMNLTMAAVRTIYEWELVVSRLLSYKTAVLPAPVSIRGRFRVRDRHGQEENTYHLDIVLDMNKPCESSEKNCQAIEALQQQVSEYKHFALLEFLKDRIRLVMAVFDSDLDDSE